MQMQFEHGGITRSEACTSVLAFLAIGIMTLRGVLVF